MYTVEEKSQHNVAEGFVPRMREADEVKGAHDEQGEEERGDREDRQRNAH